MMPSKMRLASASAAGLVGLTVAGLILFGTDPLGMGSTEIAVPAPQSAASGTPTEVDAERGAASWRPSRRPRPRPEPTSSALPSPSDAYRPAPRTTATYGPPTTYGPRPTYRRPTTNPRPTATTTTTAAARATTPAARPSTTPSTRQSTTPTPTASRAAPSPTTASPTPAAASGDYATRADWAAAVLSALNSQRAEHGLPALTSNAKLAAAAHSHNLAMVEADELSHQLAGEPDLGSRISAAGYDWSTVGENVAYNSNRSEAGVLALQQSMYSETPPNDGHRRNILSTSFTEVGIDVIDDPEHGKVWLVTDFGRP